VSSPTELDATDPAAPVRLAAAALRRSVATLDVGARLGGYEIVELLGAGGMGEVYRARDVRLARDVALKVLRPGFADPAGPAAGWLEREAQALARLRHPNVVVVHEVGRADGLAYVAMEYVAGGSLRAWLQRAPRDRAAILAVFAQAGRGLAAAHRAELVHRDVKPDNILVGDDGRVRVTDFGLAAPADAGLAHAGTPAYMAPEQHVGDPIDARADQFGFCVALHEALYGARPFDDGDRAALIAAISAGAIRPAPVDAAVPAWLRAILVRGLSAAPAARFPTMDALVDALADDPAIRRRRVLAGAGVGALAVVATIGATAIVRGPDTPPPRCATDDPRLAAVWNPDARARLTAAFAATGRPYAAERAAQVAAALDRYGAALIAMRAEACAATTLRHAQSSALLDLRNACLDRRVDQLGAQVAVLGQLRGDGLDRALEAVEQLEPLGPCADGAALTAVVPLARPALRPAIAQVEALVDRAAALQRAGAYAAGLADASVAASVAAALGHAPLRAEVAYTHATLAEAAGDFATARADLDAALEAAAAGHDDRRTAGAWALLIFVLGVDQAHLDEALALVPAARAAVARVDADPRDEAALAGAIGVLLEDKGRLDEALVQLQRQVDLVDATERPGERAARAYAALADGLLQRGRRGPALAAADHGLAIARAAVGDHHRRTAALWSMRGRVEEADGQYGPAQEDLERALAIDRELLGPAATSVGADLANLAQVLGKRGRLDDARRAFDESLAISERVLGPDHPMIAASLLGFGALLDGNRRAALALPLLTRALAISTRVAGPDSLTAARAHAALAQAYQDDDQAGPAEAHARAALAGFEHARGPADPEVATALYALAQLRESRGDAAGAVADLARAGVILERADPRSPELAILSTTLGEVQVDRGDPVAAIAPLERAAAIYAQAPPAPANAAATELALGQALWASGRDRARGLALVRAAYDHYGAADFAPERAQIDAWLRARKLAR
jgi:tetratricopeptide (TPR) repeat protein